MKLELLRIRPMPKPRTGSYIVMYDSRKVGEIRRVRGGKQYVSDDGTKVGEVLPDVGLVIAELRKMKLD